MKHRIIVAGICVCAWLCGSAQGQETSVTNLLVTGSQRQGTDSVASGTNSTAQGFETLASGNYSHAEGDTTTASGQSSHAEGGGTIAEGDQSHSEGEMTEALADNSHAGGVYARVRQQDTNAFIHASGSATNDIKETQFPNTAHFDRLVTLESALDDDNAVLSRAENDSRYLNVSGDTMGGALDMDELGMSNLGLLTGFTSSIDFETRQTETNLWYDWNADMLDGHHADYFASTQQLAQKLSVTGGWANVFNMTANGDLENPRSQLKMWDGNLLMVGGETGINEDEMHIKMIWDVDGDNPSEPGIDLKPMLGASLKGLGQGSDRWWTDGRFSATNSGKTSEFYAVQSGSFVGDGSGLSNLPTNASDARYVNISGDTMTGTLDMGDHELQNVSFISCLGYGIEVENNASMSTNLWDDWNADLLDGYHASSFLKNIGDQTVNGMLTISGGGKQLQIESWGMMYDGDDAIDFAGMDLANGWSVGSLTSTGAVTASSINSSGTLCVDQGLDGSIYLSPFGLANDGIEVGLSFQEDPHFDLYSRRNSTSGIRLQEGESPSEMTVEVYGADLSVGALTSSGAVTAVEVTVDDTCLNGDSILFGASTIMELDAKTLVGGWSAVGSTNATNFTVVGWAKIDCVPPQGGISMGIYTNR